MATVISASVYGVNQYDWQNSEGQILAFPASGVIIRPAPAGTTYSTQTMNAIIEVLPTGLTVGAPQYYTSATVDALVTLANTADT